MDLMAEIQKLIGAPPAGYEFLAYIVCACILLVLVNSAIGLLASIFRWIGGWSE